MKYITEDKLGNKVTWETKTWAGKREIYKNGELIRYRDIPPEDRTKITIMHNERRKTNN